jgi:hypothetical protein
MSALQNDTVKVVAATLTPVGDHTKLTMSTTDKVTIEFALDDLALGLLGLTASTALMSAKNSRSETPTIFKRSDEE